MDAVKCGKCSWVYWTHSHENWGTCPKCNTNNDFLKGEGEPKLVNSDHIFTYYDELLTKAKRVLEGKLIKEEVDRYNELEDKITEKAEEILQWYRENVNPLKGDDINFEYIVDGEIWYDGYDNCGGGCSLQLPIEMLYREEAKQEYLDKLERDKREKEREIIEAEKRRIKEREEFKYRQYLELKKEFEK